MEVAEFQESTTVRLDWTIRGLKQLFESSKGETKSKVTKSVKFGGGRWQILFYPNSGTEGGQFVSLYLCCEPTSEEKDNSFDGRWVRAGLYTFSFELRNLSKTILFSQKEAIDHSFSWKTANWGWAQFARRDAIYYQPNTIRNSDAFLIICTISSSPTLPPMPLRTPQRSVPKDLLDVVGSLLDDPAYSDVEFILPRYRSSGRRTRRIFAARSILKRAEYFQSMFGSGFAEASSRDIHLSSNQSDTVSVCDSDLDSLAQLNVRQFEDSDDEDEVENIQPDGIYEVRDGCAVQATVASEPEEHRDERSANIEILSEASPTAMDALLVPSINGKVEDVLAISVPDQSCNLALEERNVYSKLSHPSSPRQRDREAVTDNLFDSNVASSNTYSDSSSTNVGSSKYRVVVRDVAYATYRAVLYYLYTDSIVFAPLSSTFLAPQSTSGPPSQPYPPRSQDEGQNVNTVFSNRPAVHREHTEVGPATRTAWIRQWESQNPGKPTPCSAKAVYRVADKLGLSELKERAFQHIVKSLTIHNVPYEMFSSFSSTFEDVRKTQVAFFLEHWNEIRASRSMQTVWQQIRAGSHPGFEEVWPLIAMNLEFRPRNPDAANGNSGKGNGDTTT